MYVWHEQRLQLIRSRDGAHGGCDQSTEDAYSPLDTWSYLRHSQGSVFAHLFLRLVIPARVSRQDWWLVSWPFLNSTSCLRQTIRNTIKNIFFKMAKCLELLNFNRVRVPTFLFFNCKYGWGICYMRICEQMIWKILMLRMLRNYWYRWTELK
jgi:hypothetical protein